MKRIFLDNNSTTPCDQKVVEEMTPFFNNQFGNAASKNHSYGIEAQEAVKYSRKRITSLINCYYNEIIFTSGATESINLAIKGYAKANADSGKHIVTVKTEHKAVLDVCKRLEKFGFETTYLNVQRNGLLDLNELIKSIRKDTILISVMHANNEIGVIQPIKEIAKIAKENNVLFFVDAAQSVGKIKVDVKELGIDLMSISAHKFYGPKGIGALYISENNKIKIDSQIDGGGHEFGLRSGTLNVPAIVGFGKAAEIAQKQLNQNIKHTNRLFRKLVEGIQNNLDGIYINGDLEKRLPGNLNISIKNVDGDALLINMDEIAVSNGAACSSEKKEPSYVLKALGVNDDLASASLRFGIGRQTTDEEIDYTIHKVIKVVNNLRDLEKKKEDIFSYG